MEVIIRIPNKSSLHGLSSLLEKNNFFPERPTKFILEFNPKYNHFEPFMLTMLASWADFCERNNIEIECKNLEVKGVDYAARMGLFDFLNHRRPRELVEHESAGQFVPLCKLGKSSDISNFMGELMPILNKHQSRYADAVKYSLSELTRNVVEHAGGAPAFACAQFYKKSDKVSIGVADCGIGVKESLSKSLMISSDGVGLMEAVKPGVTGVVRTSYGGSDNAGAGLFYNKCIAHASSQYFALISGSAAFRLRRKQNSMEFKANPEEDRFDLYEGLPEWNGTVVGIDISVKSGKEFNDLMRKMLNTYTKQFRPKRKVKINFT